MLRALPKRIKWRQEDLQTIQTDGQARVWWDQTPINLFLNTTDIHNDLVHRIRWEKFAGQIIPFLSCTDLAIFKAFFNRTKDWADLEGMQIAGTLEACRVLAVIAQHLGTQDERIEHLRGIAAHKC